MESIGRSINSALQLSKRGGGVALMLTNLREAGAPIKGIENQSSGVIPVMKANAYGHSIDLLMPSVMKMNVPCVGITSNAEAALVLLRAGANPNIPNQDNVIPLSMIGGMPKRLDVLQLMLDKGGNVHHHTGKNETDILATLKKYCGDDEEIKPVIALMEKYA